MFKNKFLIFIILIMALLSIGVVSAEESSINATDTVVLDDSTTEVVTSMYDENTSLDVVSRDNIETSSQDVKTFSNENTLNTEFGDNTTFSATQNEIVASGEYKNFTELNNVISKADSTLTLDSNYKMTNDEATNFADGITISKNIAIDGKGFTIDANKLGGIFKITSGYTVSLTNVTLAKGNATMGGAIYNLGTLTLTNVIFVNNSAEKDGGAIYNDVASGSMSGCSFVNNSAGNSGGAIYNVGLNGITVSGCSFVNNSAKKNGGAIYSIGSLTVSNSAFVNNTATYYNDAIDSAGSCMANDNWWGTNNPNWNELVSNDVHHESYAVLTITPNSSNAYINFYKNGTTDVLKMPTRSLNLTIGNQKYFTEITDGTFNQPYTAPSGEYNMSVVVDNQKLVISFLYNVYVDYMEGSNGNIGANWNNTVKTIEYAMKIVLANGKIYLADGTHEVANQITIDKAVAIVGNGSTFVTNNKNGKGVFYVNASDVAIYNSTFVNNSARDGGGVIYNLGTTLTLTNVTFVNNSAYMGGAVWNDVSSLIVSDCSFVNNSVDNTGGAIFVGSSSSSVAVSGCSFVNNSARNNGGAILAGSSSSSVAVSGCSFVNNSARNNGGVIWNDGYSFTVSNSVFVNNTATYNCDAIYNNYNTRSCIANDNWWGTNNPNWDELVSDSVNHECYAVLSLTASNNIAYLNFYKNGTTEVFNKILTRSLNLTIDNKEYLTEITDGTFNQAYDAPEGEYNITAVVDNQKVTVSFLNNVYVDPVKGSNNNTGADWNNAVKTIENAMNYVLANGKIYLADGTHEVANQITIDKTVAIIGNGTKTLITNNKNGKGVFHVTKEVNNVAIYNSTFANNSASNSGGVIWNEGSDLTVSGCSFVNNSAEDGGGVIFNDGVSGFTVSGCSFVNNSASTGGAIYNMASGFTVSDCSFVNNSASDIGGVIFNDGVSGFTVSGCSFVNNSASTGGAIWNDGSSVAVSGCSFVNNSASNGSVIWNFGSSVAVSGCSFVNNSASDIGGVIWNDGSGFTVSGCSFVNNTSTGNGNAIYTSKAVIANDNWWGNNTPDWNNLINGKVAHESYAVLNLIVNDKDVSINFYSNGTTDVLPISGNVNLTIGGKETILGKIADGTFETSYTPLEGNYDITVSVDNEKLVINVVNYVYVDSVNGKDDYDGSSWDRAVKSISKAIAIVPVNGKIYLSDGIHIVDSQIEINKTVTIIGNGSKTIITTNGKDRVFKITADDVAIYNSTFVNNSASTGGAIWNGGSCLTVDGCSFVNNTADNGIIYNCGTLTLNNNIYSGISEGKTYIYNDGILSSVVVTVLDNKTIVVAKGDIISLYATITCDGASVAGGILNFTIDGVNYTADSQKNGIYNCTYKVDFDNCKVVSASFANATNSTIQTGILDVGHDVNLTVDNVVMIYHDGSRLIAKLVDALGNPIANATLTFAINGREYNRTTDVNGTASIALNLVSGKYNTTITYLGNESYNSASVNATVTVTPSIIGEDIVKMYQNDTQFYVKFIDSHGNPLVNTTVKFNINGVFYTRETDVNGTTKLNINLRPGNYTLTAYNPETGEQQGFNVLVKSLIEASDLTKYYNNESKFQAKIYNKDGSLAVNKSVTFNINGVFYTRQTDENGTVKLAINLRPGNYTITTTYDGLSIGNNVKVLPTLITNDLTMTYKDGSKFNATVLDGHGNPLANQNVTFNVNGVFYNKVTGNDGIASLNINLFRGEYIITSIWDEYQTGNKITIS